MALRTLILGHALALPVVLGTLMAVVAYVANEEHRRQVNAERAAQRDVIFANAVASSRCSGREERLRFRAEVSGFRTPVMPPQ